MLTAEVDGGLSGLVGISERDIKVATARINSSVTQTGSHNLNRLAAIVKILSERMF